MLNVVVSQTPDRSLMCLVQEQVSISWLSSCDVGMIVVVLVVVVVVVVVVFFLYFFWRPDIMDKV